jgi:hypothetical protein
MTLDDEILREAKQHRERLLALQNDVERTRSDYHYAVRRLHAAGGSMREIAEALGVSHQRVHQIVDERFDAVEEGTVKLVWKQERAPRGRRSRAPFAEPARGIITLAQHEAAVLGHDIVGTEHLLLGVLGEEEGAAAKALRRLGVDLAAARDEVVRIVGRGDCDWPASHERRLAPRTKKVLELALREALKLGDDHLGTEHVLVGLAAERRGVAARVLDALGADEQAVRDALADERAA